VGYLAAGPAAPDGLANAYIYDDSGTPAERVDFATGAVTYLVTDSLGSVRGTVDPTGQWVAKQCFAGKLTRHCTYTLHVITILSDAINRARGAGI
jgi:hypothetical protein